MDKETYRQVVNALAVVGLTLEHADYLFDNDSKAMKQVDEALLLAGIDAPMLRNRQVDRILEDTVAFNANAFENMISDVDNSFQRPEPTGVTEDHANMVEIMDMIEDELDEFDEAFVKLDDTHTEDLGVEFNRELWAHTEEEHLAEKGTMEHRMRLERRSFEERRSGDNRRWTGRNGGDRRRDFTPTHHGVDTCEYE